MKRMVTGFVIALFAYSYSGITAVEDENQSEQIAAEERSRFEVEADLIEVRAIVTDTNGQIVEGLDREDFELLENGQLREVSHFTVSKIEDEREISIPLEEKSPNKEARMQKTRERMNQPPVRTILMYVDALHLSFTSVNWVKRALRRFIDEQLTDQDLVAFTSSETLGVAQQFTRDRRILQHAVEQIRYNPLRHEVNFTPNLAAGVVRQQPTAIQLAVDIVRREDWILCPCYRLRSFAQLKASQILTEESYSSKQTLSIIEQYAKQMSSLPGKRMVVVFSDGFTSYDRIGSQQNEEFQNVASQAALSGVVIYSIDAKGLQGPPTISVETIPTSDGSIYRLLLGCLDTCSENDIACIEACAQRYPTSLVCREELPEPDPVCMPPRSSDVAGYLAESENEMLNGLHTIAVETGGKLLDKTNDLNSALGQALDDNRFYYVLSYYLNEADDRDKFRHIDVHVRNHPEYTVRAPRGFWPGGTKTAPELETVTNPQQRLIQMIGSPLPVTDLGVSVRADYNETEDDDKQVSLTIYFEGDRFYYRDQGQTREIELEILSLIYDSSGNQVEGISAQVEGFLTQQGMEQAQAYGYRFSRRLALKPGAYNLRTGVREEGTDRIGTASTWVEVPEPDPDKLGMSSLILSNPLDMDLLDTEGIDVSRLEQVKMIQGIPMYSQDDIFYYSFRVHGSNRDPSGAGFLLMRELLQGGDPVQTDDWLQVPSDPEDADSKGWVDCDGELDISQLEPGVYEIRISLKEDPSGKAISRSVAFGIL